jgi:hypothetical protein
MTARAIATGRIATAHLLGDVPHAPAAERADQLTRERIDCRHPYRDHAPFDLVSGFVGVGALIAAAIDPCPKSRLNTAFRACASKAERSRPRHGQRKSLRFAGPANYSG